MEKYNLVIINHAKHPSGETIAFQEIGKTETDKRFDTICVELDQEQRITDAHAGTFTINHTISNQIKDAAIQQTIERYKSGELNIVADVDSAVKLLDRPLLLEGYTSLSSLFDVEKPQEAITALRKALTR